MSLLFDEIRPEEVRPAPWQSRAHQPARNQSLRDTLKRAVAIEASRASVNLFAESAQEDWDLRDDFPVLQVPFADSWVECHRPPYVYSEQEGRTPCEGMPRRWAVSFSKVRLDVLREALIHHPELHERARWATEAQAAQHLPTLVGSIRHKFTLFGPENVWRHLTTAELVAFAQSGLAEAFRRGPVAVEQILPQPGAVEWMLHAMLYVEPVRGVWEGPICCWWFLLDAEGRQMETPMYGVLTSPGASPKIELSGFIFPALRALSWLATGEARLVPYTRPQATCRRFLLSLVGN